MEIYLCMATLIFSVWIQISSGNNEVSIISNGASNKNPDKEPRNISQVCSRFKGEVCGVGFVSKDKEKCIPWKDSMWYKNELFNDTTICSNHNYQYSFCATEGSKWGYCPPVKCRNIDPDENICHDQIFWSSTNSSISIDFSRATAPKKHELLIILTSLDHRGRTAQCFVTRICRGRCSSIGRFYRDSCTNAPDPINIYKSGSKVVTFTGLAQETNQILYLIPVVDDDTIGSAVTTLRMKTSLAVSHAPLNIAILDKSSTSVRIGWSPSTTSGNYGPPEGYQVKMDGGDRILNTTTNYIVFDNLSQCRLHCFAMASFNRAGKSADSTRICTNTTIDFERVELSQMKEDFPVTRLVSWRYNNANECPVVFELEYSVKNDKNVFLLKSSAYQIHLNGMETNQIYSMKVRPTFDGKHGEYSSFKYFHTFRKPLMPYDVRIIKTTPTTILLQWNKSKKTDISGPAQKYIITIHNKTVSSMYNTSIESYDFNNLHQCSYYCFTVAANNLGGTSNDSHPICGNTSTDFDEVKLLPAKSQFSSSQTVTWTYINTYKCNIVFHVEYYTKNHQNQVFSNETRDTQIKLDNLSTNDIYVVRVRPMFAIWRGQFSKNKLLYTKDAIAIMKELQIYSYKDNISVSWDIDTRISLPINIFMLKVSNRTYNCLYLVTLICSTCKYGIDESILNATQKEYLRKINECPVTKNETFHEDKVQFSNTISTNGSAINGTLVIYSVNALGIYELRTQHFYLDFKSRANRNTLLSPLLITISISLLNRL